MLVLSRKEGEEIIIGNDVIVRVLTIKQGRVRIGVIAPRGVLVDRQEIRELRTLERQANERGDSIPD